MVRIGSLVLVLLAGAAGLVAQTPGDTAIGFTLRSLEGQSTALADYQGHPVVINFWGTWCPPCKEELPMLVRSYRSHEGTGLVVLAVNGRDQETSTKAVRNFVAALELPFPVLLDEGGKTRKRYDLAGLPTTVFVKRNGTVAAVVVGPLSEKALEEHLEEILADSR